MVDYPRDPLIILLIVDGPDAGEWHAWDKDSFVSVVVWDARRFADQPQPTTYRLRRHFHMGLVWAFEHRDELMAPAKISTHNCASTRRY